MRRNALRWTHIPQAARTVLTDIYAAWYTAYAVTLKSCTKPETAEKNRQRKLAEKALRDFVNIYLRYHPDVTDEDKRNMGLHIPDGTRTPAVPPEEGPVFTIRPAWPPADGGELLVRHGPQGFHPHMRLLNKALKT
jgi:hypothetical protein